MNVLVTGGAGYIGTALVDELAQNPEINQIIIYDNLTRENRNLFINTNPHLNGKVKLIQADILDTRRIRKALKDVQVVYHLAAKVMAPFSNVDAHFFEQINHWGTAELAYALEEAPSIIKVIFVSSTAVYGASKELVQENAPPNPITFYASSKQRAEQHMLRIASKIPTTIVRCGNVYGFNTSMRFDTVINKFMFDAHFNNKISIHGNGKQTRSFVHIDRVSNLLANIYNTKEASGIYHLTDKNLQIIDLVDALKEIYPEMEFTFINQHITMEDLKVDASTNLAQFYTIEQKTLIEELNAFKGKLGFVPN
ncbi:MAG: SDR family oxidoreductase [Cytophagales bacterium]|nr:MAG: SDR family oxidoreductase [Cytophagales bacterium]